MIPTGVKVFLASEPVDFRKGHDGLAAMAHAELGFAPKAGVMVVLFQKSWRPVRRVHMP